MLGTQQIQEMDLSDLRNTWHTGVYHGIRLTEYDFERMANIISDRGSDGGSLLMELISSDRNYLSTLLWYLPFATIPLTEQIATLTQAMHSESSSVARAGLRGFRVLGVRSYEPLAERWITSDDWEKRAEAVAYLAVSNEPEIRKKLLLSLTDKNPHVREAVVDGIDDRESSAPTDEEIVAVWNLIGDQDQGVRSAVRTAVKNHLVDDDGKLASRLRGSVSGSQWDAIECSVACDSGIVTRIRSCLAEGAPEVQLATIDSLRSPNIRLFSDFFAGSDLWLSLRAGASQQIREAMEQVESEHHTQ